MSQNNIDTINQSNQSFLPLPKTEHIRVWDILVRVTHWTVTTGVIANLLFTDHGSEIHQYVGYTVVGSVVIRLLWGFFGTRYARFSNFFPTPSRIKHHLLELTTRHTNNQHLGHNPLAAIMMLSLWAAIIGLGITGYSMESGIIGNKDLLESIHEWLADSLYILIPIHVIAAIAMSYWQRQNLIKSMITGNKTVIDESSGSE